MKHTYLLLSKHCHFSALLAGCTESHLPDASSQATALVPTCFSLCTSWLSSTGEEDEGKCPPAHVCSLILTCCFCTGITYMRSPKSDTVSPDYTTLIKPRNKLFCLLAPNHQIRISKNLNAKFHAVGFNFPLWADKGRKFSWKLEIHTTDSAFLLTSIISHYVTEVPHFFYCSRLGGWGGKGGRTDINHCCNETADFPLTATPFLHPPPHCAITWLFLSSIYFSSLALSILCPFYWGEVLI